VVVAVVLTQAHKAQVAQVVVVQVLAVVLFQELLETAQLILAQAEVALQVQKAVVALVSLSFAMRLKGE
jgi:hypothetical protein